MILDAPTFELVLTPEAALGIIQKEINRKHWAKWEVEDIRLVYTPYWIFSFDVTAEGSQPSGRVALNATTGEVDEFVPQLLDRPFKKARQTDPKSPKAEVESTNISRKEVEAVAPAKVAAAVGLKKDTITVSAIAKYYVPFFRVWATVPAETGDSYKINVDALMGAPLGSQAIPGKEKGMEESTEETFDKLKSPAGWMSLINDTGKALQQGGPGGLLATPLGRWAIMLAVILVLAFFVFRAPNVGAECKPADAYLSAPEFVFFGDTHLVPKRTTKGEFYIEGTCTFTNNNRDPQSSCVRMNILDGKLPVAGNNTCVSNLVAGGITEKDFRIQWPGKVQSTYVLETNKVV